jgi:hypothetical protein
LFVEEPLPAMAIEGYRALSMNAGVAIAVGEHLQDRAMFLTFSGLTPALEISQLAVAFDLSVSPHFLLACWCMSAPRRGLCDGLRTFRCWNRCLRAGRALMNGANYRFQKPSDMV